MGARWLALKELKKKKANYHMESSDVPEVLDLTVRFSYKWFIYRLG